MTRPESAALYAELRRVGRMQLSAEQREHLSSLRRMARRDGLVLSQFTQRGRLRGARARFTQLKPVTVTLTHPDGSRVASDGA